MPRSFESLFMHFDPFLSVLEQKNLRFTTMDLLSYPLDFCSALLSVDGAPLGHTWFTIQKKIYVQKMHFPTILFSYKKREYK